MVKGEGPGHREVTAAAPQLAPRGGREGKDSALSSEQVPGKHQAADPFLTGSVPQSPYLSNDRDAAAFEGCARSRLGSGSQRGLQVRNADSQAPRTC